MNQDSENGADQDSEKELVDRELMNSMASDTLFLLRIDLLIVAVYASVIALIFQNGSQEFIKRVANSIHTFFGFQFLLGSILATVWQYIRIRKTATRDVYKNKGVINDELLLTYSMAAIALGSVISVFLLLTGIVDGFSEQQISITQLGVFLIPVWLIILLFDLLVLPEIIKKKGPKIIEYLDALRNEGGTDFDED